LAFAAARLPALADGLLLPPPLQAEGVWERIHHAVLMADRERAGREASPTAAIIDSQSVRAGDQEGAPAATTRARRSRGASGTS
jgi:transposase